MLALSRSWLHVGSYQRTRGHVGLNIIRRTTCARHTPVMTWWMRMTMGDLTDRGTIATYSCVGGDAEEVHAR